MDSSTKEPPPLQGKKCIRPTNKDETFDDTDDELLSQAYDVFITQTENIIRPTSDKEEKAKDGVDEETENISPTLDKKEITKNGIDEQMEKKFSGDSKELCNDNNINYLEDLITLEDLVEPIAAFISQQNCNLPPSPNKGLQQVDTYYSYLDEDLNDGSASNILPPVQDNAGFHLNIHNLDEDLTESSTIASILVMDIFGRVFVNEAREAATDVIEEIFTRTWKTIKPRSRWRVPDPSSWKINVARKRRAEGLPYVTKRTCRQAKIPKLIDCTQCQYKCTTKFSEEERMVLCRHYWSQNYPEKKKYILSLIEIIPIKTVTVNRKRSSLRSNSKKYFFILEGEKVQVCQKFFCQTLCISPSVITEAVNKRNNMGIYEPTSDRRGHKVPPNKTPPEKIQEVRDHIESFPKMQSHYVRKDTCREYLESTLSIPKMYHLYCEVCEKNKQDPVSEAVYRKIFCTEYNLGFFVPKKDQCLLCTRYKRTNPEDRSDIEKEYKEHIDRKNACNEEKKRDKEKAEKEKKFISATFDLQAILQIPSDEVGLLYYSRKLTVYNLTVYENAMPNEAYCFAWSEVNGKKGSAEIGSILLYYLSKCVPAHVNEVALFSDTCGGQNRNQFVASLLLWAVHNIDNLDVIEHKFLESGHTYMEVDSMHSSIESAKKHTAIYSMSEWLNVFRRARSSRKSSKCKIAKKPYTVKEMKYNDFLDLKGLAKNIMPNKIKNTEGGKVAWLKIKRMKYVKGEMKIFYNYDMSTNFFVMDLAPQGTNIEEAPTHVPAHRYRTRQKKTDALSTSTVQPQNIPSTDSELKLPSKLKQLYLEPLPITEAKKNDLLKLCDKGVIPEEYHAWFNLSSTARSLRIEISKTWSSPARSSRIEVVDILNYGLLSNSYGLFLFGMFYDIEPYEIPFPTTYQPMGSSHWPRH